MNVSLSNEQSCVCATKKDQRHRAPPQRLSIGPGAVRFNKRVTDATLLNLQDERHLQTRTSARIWHHEGIELRKLMFVEQVPASEQQAPVTPRTRRGGGVRQCRQRSGDDNAAEPSGRETSADEDINTNLAPRGHREPKAHGVLEQRLCRRLILESPWNAAAKHRQSAQCASCSRHGRASTRPSSRRQSSSRPPCCGSSVMGTCSRGPTAHWR